MIFRCKRREGWIGNSSLSVIGMEVDMFKFTETLGWKLLKATIDIVAPLYFLIFGLFIMLTTAELDSNRYHTGLLYILIGIAMWKN